jgi:3-hydroxyisobutyrate dehydrogenase-like beta-hydroxyacid dehydrogenase
MLESNEYPAQFPLKHMTKDIRFAIQTADQAGAAAPVGHAVFQLFRQGVGHDLGDLDVAAIKKVLEAVGDQ